MPTILSEETEQTAPAHRSGITWERSLGFLAVLAAALVIVLLVLSIPHMGKNEDPEFVRNQPREELPLDSLLSPSVPETEEPTEPEETVEPTIPPEANPYTFRDFQYNRHNYLLCQKQDSYPGVDVSSFQGEIDWQAVKASGIQFAMIRLGYRGYGAKGTLVEDEYAKKNLAAAKEAGIKLGAYFFSQATSITEVDDEIMFMLKILGDYELDMPIVLDWEYISDTARTANVDARTLTDCLLHYAQTMTELGYNPMTYFNWHTGANRMYLHELEEYPFWLALYQDKMTYPYRVEMWQYTCTGRVPGIQGDVDINVFMPDYRVRD